MIVSAIAAVAQNGVIGTAYATALQATVTDSGGTPVPGATVTFTVNAVAGAGATFAGSVTTVNATTNSSGIATALVVAVAERSPVPALVGASAVLAPGCVAPPLAPVVAASPVELPASFAPQAVRAIRARSESRGLRTRGIYHAAAAGPDAADAQFRAARVIQRTRRGAARAGPPGRVIACSPPLA